VSAGAGSTNGSAVDNGGLDTGVHGGLAVGSDAASCASRLHTVVAATLISANGVALLLGAGCGAWVGRAGAVRAVPLSAVAGGAGSALVNGGAHSRAVGLLAVGAKARGDSALLLAGRLAGRVCAVVVELGLVLDLAGLQDTAGAAGFFTSDLGAVSAAGGLHAVGADGGGAGLDDVNTELFVGLVGLETGVDGATDGVQNCLLTVSVVHPGRHGVGQRRIHEADVVRRTVAVAVRDTRGGEPIVLGLGGALSQNLGSNITEDSDQSRQYLLFH